MCQKVGLGSDSRRRLMWYIQSNKGRRFRSSVYGTLTELLTLCEQVLR